MVGSHESEKSARPKSEILGSLKREQRDCRCKALSGVTPEIKKKLEGRCNSNRTTEAARWQPFGAANNRHPLLHRGVSDLEKIFSDFLMALDLPI